MDGHAAWRIVHGCILAQPGRCSWVSGLRRNHQSEDNDTVKARRGPVLTGQERPRDGRPSRDEAAAYFREVNRRRVFVLEDVKGDTVMIWFAATPDEFDEFAPEAQKVVDSVKWNGS
jgi:hypothetical protein